MPSAHPLNDRCDDACIHPESVRAARAALLHSDDATRVAAMFATLSDPTRLRLVHALHLRELCVCDLTLVLGLKQPAVSQHLRLLRTLGVVQLRKEGRVTYYSLADAHIAALLAQGIAHLDCAAPPIIADCAATSMTAAGAA